MAKVTSLTAARMKQIEEASIVSGAVDLSGRLILTSFGGASIDAGDVVGPKGDKGENGSNGQQGPPGVGPTGTLIPFAGAVAPSGWLMCEGQALSRTTYVNLYNVIGTKFGAGDGSTTFNVPNLKGKVVVGVDSTDSDFATLGSTGGAKEHTLTVSEMPTHTHVQNSHNHTQNSHTHTQNPHTHTQNPHTHTQAAHNHGASSNSTGAHSHTATTSNAGAHTHRVGNTGYGFQIYKGGQAERRRTSIGTSGGYVIHGPVIDDVGYATSTNSAGGHTHTLTTNSTGGHSHTVTVNNATAVNNNSTATNNESTATNKASTATNNPTTAVNQNEGGNSPHNNLQPFIAMNYLIKF